MPEQGETYATFIAEQMAAEYERSTALAGRATAILTTSTSFVALVSAVLVFVTGKEYTFSDGGARGLLVSLASLLIAAILGFAAGASREYLVPAVDTLREMTTGRWIDHEVDARNVCAALNATTVGALRRVNNRRADILVVAFWFQLAGILGIVITIAWELRDRIL